MHGVNNKVHSKRLRKEILLRRSFGKLLRYVLQSLMERWKFYAASSIRSMVSAVIHILVYFIGYYKVHLHFDRSTSSHNGEFL